MTLQPFEVQQFGGWRPNADPLEIGWSAATDLLNVDLDRRGRLNARSKLVDTGLYFGSGASQHFGPIPSRTAIYNVTSTGGTATLEYVSNLGSTGAATSASGTWSATYAHDYAWLGTPAATQLFITSSTTPFSSSAARLRVFTVGGSVANASTTTYPYFCETVPLSNRLAIAYFTGAADAPGGANGSPSTVFFSDAGAPETFTSTNYVHLAPGDGEVITGMCAYRDFLLVFKETKFFVFYGESTDETGGPVFNYRTVKIPVGRVVATDGATYPTINRYRCAAGQKGVYFATTKGIYVTDGGLPVSVSDEDLGGLFDYDATYAYSTPIELSHHVAAANGRVFVGALSTLVYDEVGGYWLKWSTPAQACDAGVGTSRYTYACIAGVLYRYDRGSGSDDYAEANSNLNPYYYTGMQQLSPPGTEGVLREVALSGSGSVSVRVDADGTTGTSATATMSSSTLGRYRKACRGRAFQLRLSGDWDTAMGVSQVVGNVQSSRPAGAS